MQSQGMMADRLGTARIGFQDNISQGIRTACARQVAVYQGVHGRVVPTKHALGTRWCLERNRCCQARSEFAERRLQRHAAAYDDLQSGEWPTVD